MSFLGKVIIVTGAASGIGVATAELFAREGASVVMVDKDGDKLQLAAERSASEGDIIFAVTANVADDDDAKRIIKETIDKFGKLDVLVNCAGIFRQGSIVDGTILNIYDDVFNTNLRALILLTSLASPHLIETKGNVVNISSTSALSIINVLNTAYNVSKAGVDHFTRNAALELAHYGVRVNAIRPGPVRTSIIENSGLDIDVESGARLTVLDRISEPEEIGNLVMYLASDKSKGITGSIFTSDNGLLLKYS